MASLTERAEIETAKIESLHAPSSELLTSAELPADSAGWNNRGLRLFQSGQLNEAAECFKKALQADPKNFGALENLIEFFIRSGRHKEPAAALAAQWWIRSQPRSSRAWVAWAKLKLLDGKYGSAMTALTTALGLDPANAVIGSALKALEKDIDSQDERKLRALAPNQNAELARHECDARKIKVESFPPVLTIESTTVCNLRCVMCSHAVKSDFDRPQHMPEGILAKLNGPIASAQSAQLHGIGEPLLSPAFWKLLESRLFHPDCQLSFNSNLTLLDDRKLALLMGVNAKLLINVSVDAATERTYARIRRAKFPVVTENLSKLVAARGGRPFPVIHMNMTLMRENIEEAPAFVELAHGLGVNAVEMWHMNHYAPKERAELTADRDGWHFDYEEQGLWNHQELSNRCLSEAVRRAATLGMPLLPEGLKDRFFDLAKPPADPSSSRTSCAESSPAAAPAVQTVKDCRFPWEWAHMNTNGNVRPCCNATGIAGNLNEASFEEIWNSDAMLSLRLDVAENRINRVCRNSCCSYVLAMRKQPGNP